MTTAIVIKCLETLNDIKKMADLEREVWGMAPIPSHQTFIAVKNGGMVLGAFEGEEIVGFCYAFPGFNHGKSYLCSHMMGIRQAYRGRGIGKQLKDFQRVKAEELGYSLITWTFDPLESINAYLNMHKLHGIGWDYLENIYGDLDDSLNAGLPTDRFRIHWYITHPSIAEGHRYLYSKHFHDHPSLVTIDYSNTGLPVLHSDVNLDNMSQMDSLVLPIPAHYQSIKGLDMSLAIDWRLKTRELFSLLIQSGYIAVDLIPGEKNSLVSYYIFVKKELIL